MGFFEKIKNGLKKTRAAMANTLGGIFASFSGANEEFYEELEESMILAAVRPRGRRRGRRYDDTSRRAPGGADRRG